MKAGSHDRDHRSGKWRYRLEETYGSVTALKSCRTIGDLHRCLLGFLGHYGITSVVAGLVPHHDSPGKEHASHILINGWPGEWSERYFRRGYLDRDPTIRLVRRGCQHFHWNEIGKLCTVCPMGRRIMNEAHEFQLCEGITFSFPTWENVTIGLSVAAAKFDPADCDRPILQFVAAYALGCALGLGSGPVDREAVHLSRRQREAISWASEGLTVDEIAARLNVSTHTADMHLRTARARLGVGNTVHAVAESLRLGLIF
jgi:LuxR family quorum sensing-dependent transcriptional regulator